MNQGLSQKQLNEEFSLIQRHHKEILMLGVHTSGIEVSFASNKGFWLLLDTEELFVPFAEFPWFRQATIEAITTIEKPSSNHLYWPILDVDLSVESIRNPSAFPLISKTQNSIQSVQPLKK